MDFYAKAERLSDKDFKQIIGVKKATFEAMVKILKEAYARKPKKWRGGKKKKLTMENQLLMTLKYLRQYVTQKELAFEFEIGEATVCNTIRWVEDILELVLIGDMCGFLSIIWLRTRKISAGILAYCKEI